MDQTILAKLEPEEILALNQEIEAAKQPLQKENQKLKEQLQEQASKLQEYESVISQTEQEMSELTSKFEWLANSSVELKQAREERQKAESIRTQTESLLQSQTRSIEKRITKAESIEASAARKAAANQRREEQLDEREGHLDAREKNFESRQENYNREVWATANRQSKARREQYDIDTAKVKAAYDKATDDWIDEYGFKYGLMHILCGIYTLIWIIYSGSFRTDVAAAAKAIAGAVVSFWSAGTFIASKVHIPIGLINWIVRWLLQLLILLLPMAAIIFGAYKFGSWFYHKFWDNGSLAFGFGAINLVALSDALHSVLPWYNTIGAFLVILAIYVGIRMYLQRSK